MKFTSALITAVLAAAPALGFLIPADQPDGVYEVTQDTNGEYVFNEIAKISASPKPDIGRRSRISGRSGLDEVSPFASSLRRRLMNPPDLLHEPRRTQPSQYRRRQRQPECPNRSQRPRRRLAPKHLRQEWCCRGLLLQQPPRRQYVLPIGAQAG